METHDNDPTSESGSDPWTTFQEEWSDLGEQLKDTYRKVATEEGPNEDEVRQAFATLAGAWGQVAESVSEALNDPEVRHRLKEAGSAFAMAIGQTISELGTELRDSEAWQPKSADGGEEE